MIEHLSILDQRWELPVRFTVGEKTVFSDLSVIVRCNTKQRKNLLTEFDQLIQLKAASMGYDVQNIEADVVGTKCSSGSSNIWEYEFVYQVKRSQPRQFSVTTAYINPVDFNTRQHVGTASPEFSSSKLMNKFVANTQKNWHRLRDAVQLVYARLPLMMRTLAK